jgi:hypothetical protein
MSDMPIPETREIFLVPDVRDGNGRPLHFLPTIHRYSHTEERVRWVLTGDIRQAAGRDECDISYVHIFRCVSTGAERVYGCEGSPSPDSIVEQEEN